MPVPGFSIQRLYGGDLLPASEVNTTEDYIPIRDASVLGDAKHKKISVADLRNVLGTVTISNVNPTSGQIQLNNIVLWYNTSAETVYQYTNLQGKLWRSHVWSRYLPAGTFTIDTTVITIDNTNLTIDAT